MFNTYCLYGLVRKLFPKEEDRDLWKKFWGLQKKSPILHIQGSLVLVISDFMKEVVPLSRKPMNKDPRDSEVFIVEYIDKKDVQFEKDIEGLYTQFCSWATQMDSFYGQSQSFAIERELDKIFALKSRLLVTGLLMGCRIRQELMTIIFLHIKKNIGFTPSMISYLTRGFMMLKAIKYMLDEHGEGLPPYFLLKDNLSKIKKMLAAARMKIGKKSAVKQEIF